MSDDQKSDLLKHVNSSGFPFQQAVAASIDRSTAQHKWKVEAIEHRWRHPELTKSGFVDIIASHSDLAMTLIIECKRMKKEGALIFLTPKDLTEEPRFLSSFSVLRDVGNPFEENEGPVRSSFWWDLICITPNCFTSMFCSFKNQDERNPMLERITDDILPATESVAVEYLRSNRSIHSNDLSRQFIPIIVTNSKLFRCSFNTSDISLSTGEIVKESCSIEEIPYIVFKKNLASHYESVQRLRLVDSQNFVRTGSISDSNEKSVFLINSEHLSEAIERIDFKKDTAFWQYGNYIRNEAKRAEKHNQTL